MLTLTMLYLFPAVPNSLQNCSFEREFSSGDFVTVSQEKSKKVQVDDKQSATKKEGSLGELLTCPNEGCVKMHQRHSSLEKHLSFGQCKMIPKKVLFDLAKKKYHDLLVEGTNVAVSAAIGQLDDTCGSADTLPEGWALKTAKTASRFTDLQRQYLEEKFKLGQATGQKQDPGSVARDMTFAKKMDGTKLFSRDEYLNHQQVQSFFPRMAARSRQGDLSEQDITAVQDQQVLDATRQEILDQDNLNNCAINTGKRPKQLSIAMMSRICEYFDLPTEGFNEKLKAEYIAALQELVLACDCNK